MARITVPEGDGGELVQVWSLSPELGAAVGGLSAAVYGDRLVSPRVREVARMRIAQINGCNVCLQWRFPEMAERGVTEELYAHVDDPAAGDYSEQERLAIEYAEKFALDHRSLDDAFFARMKAEFTDAEILELTAMIGDWMAFGGSTRCSTSPRPAPGPRALQSDGPHRRPAGEGSESQRIWALSPELGAAVGTLATYVGGKGITLPWRTRKRRGCASRRSTAATCAWAGGSRRWRATASTRSCTPTSTMPRRVTTRSRSAWRSSTPRSSRSTTGRSTTRSSPG